jgi:hypothetical protein
MPQSELPPTICGAPNIGRSGPAGKKQSEVVGLSEVQAFECR